MRYLILLEYYSVIVLVVKAEIIEIENNIQALPKYANTE